MATFAEQLARLRVAAATGQVPPEVARWALDVIVGLHLSLARLAPQALRLEARNGLLRAAGEAAGGGRWARARRLAREIRAAPRLRERAAGPGDDGVRELVSRALAVGPGFRRVSERHLLRILS